MKDKLILIPAVPSSGTSALAGVLSHLGVDMGKLDSEGSLKKRGYEMYEDTDLWKFCVVKNREAGDYTGKLQLTQFRFRSYINHRLIQQEKHGNPVGAKIPAVLCLHDPEPEDLPIVTLNIHRGFEQCLVSDRSTMIRQGVYEKLGGDLSTVLAFNIARSGDMGACVAGKMDLYKYHEPVVNITFDELVAKRAEIVPSIAKALDLSPTDDQLMSAIDFLDKDKKHS